MVPSFSSCVALAGRRDSNRLAGSGDLVSDRESLRGAEPSTPTARLANSRSHSSISPHIMWMARYSWDIGVKQRSIDVGVGTDLAPAASWEREGEGWALAPRCFDLRWDWNIAR